MRSPNRSNYQRKVSFPLYISMWQRASDPFGKLSGSIRKGHRVAPRRWERREREAEGGSTRTRRHSVVRPTKSSVSRSEEKKIGNPTGFIRSSWPVAQIAPCARYFGGARTSVATGWRLAVNPPP